MKKAIRIILDIILTSIPAFLSYLASSTIFFDSLQQAGYLGQGVNIAYIQDCCLWIGIVLTAVLSTARLIYRQWKLDNSLKQRSSLIRMNKRILESSLSEKVSEGFANCDIRIFVPKHPLLYKLTSIQLFHNMKREFVIKNYDTIANEGTTRNLTFEVYPNVEGLVGKCYNKQSIIYDDNLKQTNSTNYGLNETQISRTTDLAWSICCPVFSGGNDVIAIVALDGKTPIHISNEVLTPLREEITVFSQMLSDSVPELFKKGIFL